MDKSWVMQSKLHAALILLLLLHLLLPPNLHCQVVEATLPLYSAMILAYLSIKWWKLFTPEQCSGINKFVSKFSIPLLSFHVISTSNPYQMNLKLVCADIMQKLSAMLVFAIVYNLCSRGSLDWLITGFSLSTLPNTLVVGIPLLKGMYGAEAVKLLGQIIVLQSLLWYTLLLFLFEFRTAKAIDARQNANPVRHWLNLYIFRFDLEEEQTKHEEEDTKDSARIVRSRAILLTVGRKLMINPNTYSCLFGLIWALISFRWGLELPPLISNSITIISDGGLGMAMFSIGLFTALKPKIIACGTRLMILSIGLRFIIGPALMAIPSFVLGLRGELLNAVIVQAALPQGIVPFVFAREYNVHPDIISTGIIVGMITALPVALVYYLMLGLH